MSEQDDTDFLDELRDDLWWQQSDWIRTKPHNGNFAMFPKTVTDVAKWERDCIAMHNRQRAAAPLKIEDKPVDNTFKTRMKKMRRGD